MRLSTQTATFLTFAAILCSEAAEWHVDPAGTGDFVSIQTAVYTAAEGDTVIVHPGTYVEYLTVPQTNLTLCSTDPTATGVVAATVITSNGHDLVTLMPYSAVRVAGFTLTGGRYAVVGGSNDCVIERNVIRNNNTGVFGCNGTIQYNEISGNAINEFFTGSISAGGIYGCNGMIQYNVISGNQTLSGSGAGLGRCSGTIQHNMIAGNHAEAGNGGGLYICSGTIQYNTIVGNIASWGNGGGLYRCTGTLQYNIISGNTADRREYFTSYHGGGMYECGGMIQNNIISSNRATGGGGGLQSCTGIIQSNIVAENSADVGGGFSGCEGTLRHNLVSGNTALSGGGINGGGGWIYGNTVIENEAVYSGGGVCGTVGAVEHNLVVSNSAESGGGIAYGSGMIRYNTIILNRASLDGGGVFRCDGTTQYNTISANIASGYGGGASGVELLFNNVISSNVANAGGGIDTWYLNASSVLNNLILGNSASDCGGGIYVHGGTPDIRNNTIVMNSAAVAGGGIYYDWVEKKSIAFYNCIVWSNWAPLHPQYGSRSRRYIILPRYCCIQDGRITRHCIKRDPQFAGANDFHLTDYSPCIDVGTTLSDVYAWTDLDAGDRVVNSIVDMGCYEHAIIPEPTALLSLFAWILLSGRRKHLSSSDKRPSPATSPTRDTALPRAF